MMAGVEIVRGEGSRRVQLLVARSPLPFGRAHRFGFKYLEQYFNSHGVEIEVIFDDGEKTPEKELVEDLLAIVTSFAGKLYGMRFYKKKHLVEAVKNALRDN